MERELFKEIICFIIILATDGIYYPCAIFYPYLATFYKQYDETIGMRDVFTAFGGYHIGRFIGNLILPYLIYFLGCKKTIQIGGILYCINCYFFAQFPSKITLNFCAIFNGFIFQLKVLPINFFMSKKYENGIMYSDHIYSGFSISAFIWSLCLTFIVNPKNKEMDKITYINGYEEKYFDKTISDRMGTYLLLNGTISLIVIIICTQFIKGPSNFPPSYLYYYKKFFGNLTEEEEEENSNSLENILKKPIIDPHSSVSINSIKSLQKENSLLETETNNEKKENLESFRNESIIEMKKLKFILLIFIFVLKSVSCSYFYGYSKYISYGIVNNDRLISFLFAFVSIPDIAARYVLTYIWKKKGFYNTIIICICFSIFLNLTFLFIGYKNATVFIFLIFAQVFNFALVYLTGNLTLFSLYKPEVALFLTKIFDSYMFFYRYYSIFLNAFFVYGDNYFYIFFIMLIGEFIALYLFVVYYKNHK